MKKINLRAYYPDYYNTDYIIEVPDEVMDTMQEAERKENAYQRRKFRHKAYYSLDRNDGIEHDTFYQALTPQDICEQQELMEQISIAISQLSEKQARRIHAYYFHGMSYLEIAEREGVHRSQIMRSVNKALANKAVILKNYR